MADSHESRLEKAVDVALQFYESNGIPVSKRPSVSFDLRDNPLTKPFGARAHVELEVQEALHANSLKVLTKGIFKECYGLTVSRAALDQYAAEMTKEAVKGTNDIFSPFATDIIVYPGYFALPMHEQQGIIVHELWHITEANCGIFQKSPLLGEGTATLTQSRYLKRKCSHAMEKCTNFPELYYEGVANELEKALGTQPLKCLLDEKFRLGAEQNIFPKLEKYAPRLIEAMVKNPQMKEVQREAMRNNPICKLLPKDLTKKDLLDVFRLKGQNLLASELEAQDCTKLIATYKEFL